MQFVGVLAELGPHKHLGSACFLGTIYTRYSLMLCSRETL